MNILRLQNLALMYMCLWVTSPLLLPSALARVGALLAILMWAGLELFRPNSIFIRPTLPALGAALFIGYDLLLWFLLRDWALLGHIQLYIVLVFVLVYESRRTQVASLIPVFWFVLLTIPIWLFTTLRAFESMGIHVMRTVIRSSDAALELMQQGVGGYSLVYGALFLVPILLPMLLRNSLFDLRSAPSFIQIVPHYKRLIPAVILGMVVALIVRSGFSIANVLLVSTMLASILFLWLNRWAILGAMAAVITVLLFGEALLSFLISMLLPVTEGTNYINKLRDIQHSLEIGSSAGTVSDRTERYLRSLSSFLDNPLFGTLIESRGIGGHSEYLDHFAQRGILFGGLFMALMLYLPIKMLRRLPANLSLTGGMLTVMIVFPLLNSVTAIFGVMLFVVFPAACAMTHEFQSRNRVARQKSRAVRFGVVKRHMRPRQPGGPARPLPRLPSPRP